MPEDDNKELIDSLIAEAKEHLSNTEPDLLFLEKDGNNVSAEIIDRLFRSMHSIKGAFSFFDVVPVVELAHTMENLLSLVRDKKLSITNELVDVLLIGKDKLALLIDNFDNYDSISISDELEKLNNILEGNSQQGSSKITKQKISKTKNTKPKPKKTKIPKSKIVTPETILAKDSAVEKTEVLTQVNTSTTTHPDEVIKRAVKSENNTIYKVKSAESLRVKVDLLNKLMNLVSELVIARNQLGNRMNQKAFDILNDKKVVQKFNSFVSSSEKTIYNKIKSHYKKKYQDINKSTNNNDFNNFFEKVVTHELNGIKDFFLQTLSLSLVDIPCIKSVTQNIDLLTSSLQESTMQTRLQQVETVFAKLPRITRDLARKLKKQIKIVVTGGEVELDKSIIEILSDPLTHIIRNCADHGIETPEIRLQKGKPLEGTVNVKAYHESGEEIIEISDDGNGIDADIVKSKAIEKGIISLKIAEGMTKQEIQELIFAPGFSSAEQVTDVSGRGVGMDVVKTNIAKIGGFVELISTLGRGTTIKLKLPLTIEIVSSLLVRTSDRMYAVPQESMVDLVRIRAKDISKKIEILGDSVVIRRGGRLLPVIKLADVFGLKSYYRDRVTGEMKDDRRKMLAERRTKPIKPISEEELLDGVNGINNVNDDIDEPLELEGDLRGKEGDRRVSTESALQILIAKVGIHKVGLIVDELLDIEELVVKPLSRYFKQCKCYAGATILGNGKLALVIDTQGVSSYMNLDFSGIQRENDAQNLILKRSQMNENQNLLLFKNGSSEVFALPIDLISRIKKVKTDEIDKIGDKEFIKNNGKSLRIIRLHNYMDISTPGPKRGFFYLLIPKLMKHPISIVMTEVLDIIKTGVSLDKTSVSGTGIIGSAIINNSFTIFIDIYNLFETVDPDNYKGLDSVSKPLLGKRILLAEDTQFFQKIISKYLEEAGCEVDVAKNGMVAWDMLNKDKKYQLLITDIHMPLMDGYELSRKIRASAKFKLLPIVVVTAMEIKSYYDRAMEVGVNRYQQKLDKEKLLKTVIELLP